MNTSNIERKGSAWFVLCAMCCFSITLSAQAASFDCAKAQSKVEHMICDSPEISKLDEELNEAYKAALQNQTKADAIKQAQKQWVKERNVCRDAACVKDIYDKRLAMLTTSANEKTIARTAANKYEFKLEKDNGWAVCRDYLKSLERVQPSTESLACELTLDPGMKQFSPPNWEELNLEDHLDVVYGIEKEIGGRSHPAPAYDAWREEYLAKVKSGEIKPRLRRAVFHLPSRDFDREKFKWTDLSREDVFYGYTRNRDNVETCKKEIMAGTYLSIPRDTGDGFYYLDPTSKTFQHIYPDTGAHFLAMNGAEVQSLMHGGVVFLQASSPAAPTNGYNIFFYRLFSINPDQVPGMELHYYAQDVCRISARPISVLHH